MTTARVRVFLACSLDGFIAGPADELDWLDGADPGSAPPAEAAPVSASEGASASASEGASTPASEAAGADPDALDYHTFIAEVGALLMGRRTYDVVRGMDVPWPYGERPVLVATHRPLDADPPPTVRAVQGPIEELIETAKGAAAEKDVYLDGGILIRQAAEAGLIDDLTITIAPVALGKGISLFAGLSKHYRLEIVSHHRDAMGMVQLRLRGGRVEL